MSTWADDLPSLLDKACLYSISNDKIINNKVNKDNIDDLINILCYNIFITEPNRNDSEILVKNRIYEGGFTVWESSWNFLKYLEKNLEDAIQGSNLLDLGSGGGLLGLLAYLKGYNVCFQDMNHEVLERLTTKNFILTFWFDCLKRTNIIENKGLIENALPLSLEINTENTMSVSTVDIDLLVERLIASKWLYKQSINKVNNSVGFTCSTWDKLTENINNIRFDYILSSETLYRTSEYPNLVKILERYLKDTGIAYFATKRLYFGIGGGSFEFIEYIDNNTKILKAEIVYSIKEDRSVNIIDIIKITKLIT